MTRVTVRIEMDGETIEVSREAEELAWAAAKALTMASACVDSIQFTAAVDSFRTVATQQPRRGL